MPRSILHTLISISAAGLTLAAAVPSYADRGSDDRRSETRGHGSDRDNRTRDDRRGGRGDDRVEATPSAKSSVRLIARMSSAGVVAKAKYETQLRRRVAVPKFSVEVERARPGEKFEVVINARPLGTITANSFGVAKLELRRSPSGVYEQPIPADFPALKSGDVVKVGEMSGTLR